MRFILKNIKHAFQRSTVVGFGLLLVLFPEMLGGAAASTVALFPSPEFADFVNGN